MQFLDSRRAVQLLDHLHDARIDFFPIHFAHAKRRFTSPQEVVKVLRVFSRSDFYCSKALFVVKPPKVGVGLRSKLYLDSVRTTENLKSIANDLAEEKGRQSGGKTSVSDMLRQLAVPTMMKILRNRKYRIMRKLTK